MWKGAIYHDSRVLYITLHCGHSQWMWLIDLLMIVKRSFFENLIFFNLFLYFDLTCFSFCPLSFPPPRVLHHIFPYHPTMVSPFPRALSRYRIRQILYHRSQIKQTSATYVLEGGRGEGVSDQPVYSMLLVA